MPNPNDLLPSLYSGVLDAIGDSIDAGQDVVDTLSHFVAGNDDNDFRSEIENGIEKNYTLTQAQKDDLVEWTKPLANDFTYATFPRYGRKHAKHGEIMKPVGFKVVRDIKADGGVRVNFFANEPFAGDYNRGYKAGFEAGQRSRQRMKKISV